MVDVAMLKKNEDIHHKKRSTHHLRTV